MEYSEGLSAEGKRLSVGDQRLSSSTKKCSSVRLILVSLADEELAFPEEVNRAAGHGKKKKKAAKRAVLELFCAPGAVVVEERGKAESCEHRCFGYCRL